MSAEAKNLEAITKAIIQHNGNCPFDLLRIEMNHHEVERLGWDDIRGIPVVGVDDLGSGRFRLICEKDEMEPEQLEDAIGAYDQDAAAAYSDARMAMVRAMADFVIKRKA